MSTTDKTGDKLVDSMRKTKAAAASDKSDTSQNRGHASRKKSQQPVKKKTGAKRPAVGKRGGDPYQSGRRIWPD